MRPTQLFDGTNWVDFTGTTPVVAMSASLSTTTAYGTNATIVFDSVEFDTSAAYNNTTGVFTAPTTGIYNISVSAEVSVNNSTLYLWKNGTTSIGYLETLISTPIVLVQNAAMLVSLAAGDTIEIKCDNAATFDGPTINGKLTYLQINLVK